MAEIFYDRKKLFDKVRNGLTKSGTLTQDQVDGLEILVAEGEKRNFNTEWIAYVLGTAWHETGFTMQPVRETFASSDKQAINRLTTAWKAGKLKVSQDYWSDGYFGRGYVQLTHEYNYKKMGDWLGIDLVKNPSKALEPAIAARIIYEGMLKGMFTGKKLPDYLDGVDGPDAEDVKQFESARYIVNGKDKAKAIAGYALKFEAALRASEGAMPAAVAAQVDLISKPDAKLPTSKPSEEQDAEILPTAPQNEPKPASQSTTIMAALGGLATSVVGILANLNPIIQGLIIVGVAGFAFWIIRERMKKGNGIGGLF